MLRTPPRASLTDPVFPSRTLCRSTGNFVAGPSPFAIMVALLVDGETVAAWIRDPITDRLAMAERGGGAYIDGVRIRTVQDSDLTLRDRKSTRLNSSH